MLETREKIQRLARVMDINKLSYREIGRQIANPVSGSVHPQIVKNIIIKLKEEGLISNAGNIVATTARLVTIPILGKANAGPATHVAGSDELGTLKVSASLLPNSNYSDLYALEVDGESMNKAKIRGNHIENGAYVIVDSSKKTPKEGEVVTVIHEGLSNIKSVHFDYENELIVLHSESSQDFQPIVINPQDNWEGLIGGTVIQVVRKPELLAS